jgi:hypothetical protein
MTGQMSLFPSALEHLWSAVEAAGQFDPTLKISRRAFSKMLRRYVRPMPYARETLFDRMLAGQISVLAGMPAPLRPPLRDLPPAQMGPAIISWFETRRSGEKHPVHTGADGVRRYLTLKEIALKWRANRARFGVSDLHIRGSMMENIAAPDVLSSFNLLPHSSVLAREQEMFSFVISSRGQVTDSHSDAPDSSNFCLTGRKLWLAWDTYEGMRRGLQDVERTFVQRKAHFDMDKWLSLRSARWLLVNPGETLFLPAHLTHKVITLEPYIGLGGFFIALPNSLRLLSHWIIRGPLWSKRDSTGHRDELLGEIAQSVRDAVLRLRGASLEEREQWGYDYLEPSAQHFIRTCPAAQFRKLWADPRFRCVAETIREPWPLSSKPGLGSA